MIEPLQPEQSLEVYQQYPETFSNDAYNNYSYKPKLFTNKYTPTYFNIPNELQRLTPAKLGGENVKVSRKPALFNVRQTESWDKQHPVK